MGGRSIIIIFVVDFVINVVIGVNVVVVLSCSSGSNSRSCFSAVIECPTGRGDFIGKLIGWLDGGGRSLNINEVV